MMWIICDALYVVWYGVVLFIVSLAEKSGMMLDPVYSGKVCDCCCVFVDI
jgi:1-aminocyclopropane-1-carboxylate deaminase/D-cysteine desulfhydrase-like pyridoxal-dependent ACC family enzyme